MRWSDVRSSSDVRGSGKHDLFHRDRRGRADESEMQPSSGVGGRGAGRGHRGAAREVSKGQEGGTYAAQVARPPIHSPSAAGILWENLRRELPGPG